MLDAAPQRDISGQVVMLSCSYTYSQPSGSSRNGHGPVALMACRSSRQVPPYSGGWPSTFGNDGVLLAACTCTCLLHEQHASHRTPIRMLFASLSFSSFFNFLFLQCSREGSIDHFSGINLHAITEPGCCRSRACTVRARLNVLLVPPHDNNGGESCQMSYRARRQ